LPRPLFAGPTYQASRIKDITVSADVVLIKLDSGLPDNCAGTPYGWTMIRAQYKTLLALVLGLWLTGDAAQVGVTVYTSGGIDGTGYCQVDRSTRTSSGQR
jgi:hypothetical protein